MKIRVFSAIIMLFLAVSLCVLSLNLTEKYYDDITEKIELTEEYILTNNKAAATATALELAENWEFQQNIFSLFIHHSGLERTDLTIHSISKYLSIDDTTAALILCEDAKISIEEIYKDEKPSFWNLF
ncbi:MAG: DUF4363 family protein [Clostridia bacterium]